MATAIILLQFAIVLALIFKGARVGGIGLGIYGMVGVFILVFIFGLKPGNLPIDVMLIIVSVITAAATLQAAGGLDYLVGLAAKFLRKHPTHITYFGPLTTWLFCLVAGTAHTSYSLLPIISEIATNSKIRPERPLSVATVSASLGITGSPVSAATAAVISTDLLGGAGIELKHILIVCIPASLIAILVAAFVQNRIGKDAVKGNVFAAGINALVAIFGIAWMGDTFFNGNLEFFKGHIANIVTQYPFLFAIALFIMAIMLFSQAATVRTLYPLGIGLGISPLALVAMFPAVNGYFFLPNYPTTVAAINFDRTGSTRIGRFVINHSFQLAGFITTFVSIGVGYLIIQFL